MKDNFFERLNSYIDKYQNIFITTHIVPDADGLGSQVALTHALKQKGKNVICVNEKSLLERYKYLDQSNNIISLDDFLNDHTDFEIDLVIIVDTNKVSRTGMRMSQFLSAIPEIIYIDHHPSDKKNEGEYFINTKAAATGQIVGEYIQSLNIKFNEEMALALYTAILIDTNTFRYPSVSGSTHQLIASLLDTGIKTTRAYNHIYGTKRLKQMHLLGSILSGCKTTENGEVAWIYINQKTFDLYEASIEDTHAYINNLLILENVKVVCMFREEGHRLKLSLRSHGDIDVGEIAQEFGGGGHNHSAATIFEIPPGYDKEKTIETSIKKILKLVIDIKSQ